MSPTLVVIARAFIKHDRRTALPRAYALGAGFPLLEALEHGNLIIPTLSLVILAYGPLLRSTTLRWIAIGLAVNFKIYVIASIFPYRDIPIKALDEQPSPDIAGRTVLIGLHNHYVDVKAIDAQLRAARAARVLTPVNLPELIDIPLSTTGYWLDRTTSSNSTSKARRSRR